VRTHEALLGVCATGTLVQLRGEGGERAARRRCGIRGRKGRGTKGELKRQKEGREVGTWWMLRMSLVLAFMLSWRTTTRKARDLCVHTSDSSTVHFLGVGDVCTLSRPGLVLQSSTVALVNTTTSSAILEDTCRLLRGDLNTLVEAAEMDSPCAQQHSV
jgi:hypothetical protein